MFTRLKNAVLDCYADVFKGIETAVDVRSRVWHLWLQCAVQVMALWLFIDRLAYALLASIECTEEGVRVQLLEMGAVLSVLSALFVVAMLVLHMVSTHFIGMAYLKRKAKP